MLRTRRVLDSLSTFDTRISSHLSGSFSYETSPHRRRRNLYLAWKPKCKVNSYLAMYCAKLLHPPSGKECPASILLSSSVAGGWFRIRSTTAYFRILTLFRKIYIYPLWANILSNILRWGASFKRRVVGLYALPFFFTSLKMNKAECLTGE